MTVDPDFGGQIFVGDQHAAERGEKNAVGEGEDEGRDEKGGEISGAVTGLLLLLSLRRLVVPMSFTRTEPPVEHYPDADEQSANERFEPVEHQHGARGPVAEEPAGGWNGVQAESREDASHGSQKSEVAEP